jgi:glycosyltransferase involved in cell wall biosynthesis
MNRLQDDPKNFDIRKITLDAPFEKYGLLERWFQERRVGQAVIDLARDFKPDRVISANTPLGAQGKIIKFARRQNIPFTFWLQDMLGIAIAKHLRERIPVIGVMIGAFFQMYEAWQMILSDSVVAITQDFIPHCPRRLMTRGSISVIENWAPLEDLPLRPRINNFSQRHGLAGKTNLLYSGTLGLKHNPELLVRLADQFRDDDNVRIVIVSEGVGADYLKDRKTELGLSNLILLPFQNFEEMPEVLATADILIAILEKDAGTFSVPSKLLTYLCAARPLLIAIPEENLAARIVDNIGAGLRAPADCPDKFVTIASHLIKYPSLREPMAKRARQYAEQTFDIEQIASKFETIFLSQEKLGRYSARLGLNLNARKSA